MSDEEVGANNRKQLVLMGGSFITGMIVATILFAISSPKNATIDTQPVQTAETVSASSASAMSHSSAQPAKPVSEWVYDTTEDEMTGKKRSTATVTSTNYLNLASPYDGPQKGRIIVRKHPQFGRDVIITIEQGQLLCDISNGCSLLVRFDDDAPSKFSATTAADHSSEVLFIDNYKRFTDRLAVSKKVRIQLEVYQNGNQMVEFNTEGFDPSGMD